MNTNPLKINKGIAIWSTPVELFCEVSNEVRSRSPFTPAAAGDPTEAVVSQLHNKMTMQQVITEKDRRKKNKKR
ncbi:MAG TPA: hypothetical protein PLL71_01165 [Agriterribacter sp.]|nr:hypothetical protein [Agriterribacter sp.]HRQ51471.1 hypothetical protein [Agriterribacter sp.]